MVKVREAATTQYIAGWQGLYFVAGAGVLLVLGNAHMRQGKEEHTATSLGGRAADAEQ